MMLQAATIVDDDFAPKICGLEGNYIGLKMWHLGSHPHLGAA